MKAQDIKAGSKFTMYQGDKIIGGWKATGDAVVAYSQFDQMDLVYVPVRYLDGGDGTRIFEVDSEVPID